MKSSTLDAKIITAHIQYLENSIQKIKSKLPTDNTWMTNDSMLADYEHMIQLGDKKAFLEAELAALTAPTTGTLKVMF